MGSAVESVERAPSPDPEETRPPASAAKEPQPAGASARAPAPADGASEAAAASVDAAQEVGQQRPAQAVAKRAGGGALANGKKSVFSRTDAFDEAIQRSAPGRSDGSRAGGSASRAAASESAGAAAVRSGSKGSAAGNAGSATGGTSLAGLRKMYVGCGAGAPAGSREQRPLLAESPDGKNSNRGDMLTETGGGGGDSQGAEEDDEEAKMAEEWQGVAQRSEQMAREARANVGVVKAQDDIMAKPIAYREVETWLTSYEVDSALLQPLYDEEVEDGGCGCMTRRRSAMDIPGLDKRFLREKDLMLCLKCTDFDFNNVEHFRMLRTMYMKLTRNKVCPTIGHHWGLMGFQGGDPRTDLNRSGGVLNVLHMFYFYAHYFEILKAAYLLAQDTEQNFPLFCVSINLSRMVVERFLAGSLSSVINRSGRTLLQSTFEVYAGALHYFYMRWRTQKRTIEHTDMTFKEVRALMTSKPKTLLDELQKGLDERRQKTDASRLEFTDMSFGSRSTGAAPPPAAGAPRAKAAAVPSRLRNYVGGADDGD
eukprot:TRINITY_DN16506_c0_g1_i1.p1 TRINITY_DN16506_c0_g1~~TRINITY_DN16506_c0_g1_i1.p1  ORF type:complete len:632 (-),score=153.87 TRINITY_DN16506_c0_g1_i1:108-1724(-)